MEKEESQKSHRVLIDIGALAHERTGIRTYIEALLLAVEQNDSINSNWVVGFVPKPNLVSKFRWLERLKFGPFKWLFHFFYFCWKQLCLPIKSILFRADVLLVPDYVLPAWKTAKLQIAVIHDAFLWNHPEMFGNSWRQYFTRSIKAGLSSNAIALTVSNYSKNSLKPWLSINTPIKVIYPFSWFGNSKIHGASVEVLRSFGLDKSKYIFHAGLFDARKDLQTLVEAFAIIRQQGWTDIRLVLTGKIDPTNTEFIRIEKLLQKYHMQSAIVFTDYVSQPTLEILYESADLYVFPSRDEGFGLPVLEAMSFNTPVVVSDSGALAEIGGEAVEVFSSGDYKELANVMMSLLSDPKRQKELIALGQKRYKEFNSIRFSTELNKVITDHMNR